jgi:hypothetical protein
MKLVLAMTPKKISMNAIIQKHGDKTTLCPSNNKILYKEPKTTQMTINGKSI